MRTEQIYLDHVREKMEAFKAFEKRLEQALMKPENDVSCEESSELYREYLRLGLDEEEDTGATLENPEEIKELLDMVREKVVIKKAPRN
jgi:hypothetical protein